MAQWHYPQCALALYHPRQAIRLWKNNCNIHGERNVTVIKRLLLRSCGLNRIFNFINVLNIIQLCLVVREKSRIFVSEKWRLFLQASAVKITSVINPSVVTPWLHSKMMNCNFLKVRIFERGVHSPLSPRKAFQGYTWEAFSILYSSAIFISNSWKPKEYIFIIFIAPR